MTRGALPTFLVVGAMKCGTTSLHYYLHQHPAIQMATIKETNFFAPPVTYPYYRGTKLIHTLDAYERLFDARFDARGEASPSYTEYPRRPGVPERIKATIPTAKLIYLVRDPIERIVSHYKHRVAVEHERHSLSDVLQDLSDQYSTYICQSLYAFQLQRYLAHFNQDRVLVVDHADLLRDRRATLARIFDFVGVDRTFTSPHFDEVMNTGGELRTYSAFVILLQRARSSPLKRLPRGLRVTLRTTIERAISKPLADPVLDDDLRCRLQEFYARDAERLRSLTGEPFATWSV